jgi:gamma-butyrobetaine dioxygenase/trimethyllysine dioxygenase
VRRDGLVVVRAPSDPERAVRATEPLIAALAGQGLAVRETHFGRVEDLRPDNTTNANTDQLGYTDAPIELHTDQPFLPSPPRYQLLQGIAPAEQGGENAFVDAFLAARWLRAHEQPDHDLLAETKVRFHRKQKAFERVVEAPVLGYQRPGELDGFQVRFSYFTLAPHRLPFARMAAYYRAYTRFTRLVRDPRRQLRALLRPGDFVLYDNHRVLHSRLPFRGPRWVRGVYFDPA